MVGIFFGLIYWVVVVPLALPARLFTPRPRDWVAKRPSTAIGFFWVRAAAFCVYYLLLFLACGEVVIRLAGPTPVLTYSADERAAMKRPYGEFTFRGLVGTDQQFSVPVRLNSMAYHDVEHARAKPADRRRLLILGDSYVAAWEVPLEKAFFRLLESRLDRVEVIAMGRPGVGQVEEIRMLERDGLAFDPDIVLAEFLPFNDVRDNASTEHPEEERSTPEWAKLPFRYSRFLMYLANQIEWTFEMFRRRRLPPMLRVPKLFRVYLRNYEEPWIAEGWKATFRALLEMRDACRARRARFVVVCFPGPFELEASTARKPSDSFRMRDFPASPPAVWDPQWPTQRMAEFCRANEIEFFDLAARQAEVALKNDVELLWPQYVHWNEAGHASAADLLAKYFIETRPRAWLDTPR